MSAHSKGPRSPAERAPRRWCRRTLLLALRGLLVVTLPSACDGVEVTPAPCGVGLEPCGGACVDIAGDPRHCGACAEACPPGVACEQGRCAEAPECEAGQLACGGGCVDPLTDPAHCGGCDVRCAAARTCSGGVCSCAAGLSECGGACVDLQRNEQHCGQCGAACPEGLTCAGGACLCVAEPFEDLGSEVPRTVTGSTAAGARGVELSCGGASALQRAYLFTAPSAGAYVFDTAGSRFDTALGVLRADSCEELSCNDDSVGSISRATVPLDAGQRVSVVVTGFNGARGDFTLSVRMAPPPTCPSGELEPTVPQTVLGDTTGLGDAITPTCESGGADASYTFTAPYEGRFIFDTRGSSFDTVLELRDAGCAGPVLACNDNTDHTASRVELDLAAGQTVVAVVDGARGEAGRFSLNISERVVPMCNPLDLGSTVPQTASGTTAGAPDVAAPSCAPGGPDAVYTFTAAEGGEYTFDTIGSAYDTVLHVHDGDCFGAELACNDDSVGLQSVLRVSLTAGQTVSIVVDGYGGSAGAYVLQVSR